MRVERNDITGTTLVVSRKNLLTLLAKLDANVLAGERVSHAAIVDPDGVVLIHAEEDDVHYDPELRASLGHAAFAGPMHPREEGTLKAEWTPGPKGQPRLRFYLDPKQDGDGKLMNPDGAF